MELTEDQNKGINMMSKILGKRYPYIIGASPNTEDFELYSALITFKLIVSKSKLEEYFKQKVVNDWDEFWRFGNLFYPNPDPNDLLIDEIKSLGKLFYNVITDEYKFKCDLSIQDFRIIRITSFILDDTN